MNCKQGDLAIIIHPGVCYGKLVEVMYSAPQGQFILPNGVHQAAADHGDPRWVIKSLGTPFPRELGMRGDGMYATTADKWLRPLRGDLLNDEITNSKELEAA